ncbi:MAG: nitroreductase family protein [Phycisphaerales bacterium]
MVHPSIPFRPYVPVDGAVAAAARFQEVMAQRRSIRAFSPEPVPAALVRSLVGAAGTAPSGANKQPWRFVAVSDAGLKRRIREGAEAEEREFYSRRAGEEWLNDLAPLGTDDHKEFLEVAPWLVVVFKLMKADDGSQVYYVNESVGIAVGLFLAAAQHAGLATLTHTPSPMGFLTSILGRPENERPFLLIPLGYAAHGCTVPDIQRKPVDEIMVINRPPGPAA